MKPLKNEKGTIFMELCVSLAVISVILLFVAQVGLGFREWNLISFAAREGARYGAETQSQYKARERAESLIKSNKNINQNASLGNQYSITSKQDNGLMYVTITWHGRGLNIESTKCFRLAK